MFAVRKGCNLGDSGLQAVNMSSKLDELLLNICALSLASPTESLKTTDC